MILYKRTAIDRERSMKGGDDDKYEHGPFQKPAVCRPNMRAQSSSFNLQFHGLSPSFARISQVSTSVNLSKVRSMHHLSSCKSSQQHENEMFTQPEVRSQCPYVDHLPSMLYLNNNQNPTMSGHSVFPSIQGEPLSDLLADAHISRHPYINSYTHQSQGLDIGASTNEQVEYENGTLVPATVLQTLLASRACVYENVDDPALCHVSNSRAFVYDQMQSSISDVWLQPQPVVSDNESLSYLYNAAMFNNELLSLSLTTLQSNGVTQDHRAEMSCSDVTMNHELGRCSEPVSGSNYLMAMQEILADMSRFSFENVDMGRYDSNSMPSNSGECSESGGRVSLQRHEIDTKKKQLKILLKMADDGYNNCLKEVHNVISKFHPITGLNHEEHAHFVLQTTSFLYRSLKERISAQIHEMKAHLRSDSTTEQECSFDSTFIHKQWAIQQMRRKEHQLWRPQRGLPERSVSVLRAWMFQNFLRPYPKDSEKHMLAIKSGLTRSQVSNWFINARVRLWKPMIEEMYAEINRRKSHWKGHATDDSTRGDSSMGIQRFERD